MHSRFLTILLSSSLALGGPTVPTELFSSMVPTKILATFNALPSPSIKYPQYTDMQNGVWQYFVPDTWTSGFFPLSLYELNKRKTLCGATDQNGLGIADWLDLGRYAVNGEIPLEIKNGVGHDVGFLSMPFVEELTVNPENETALTAVKNFADDLAARFSPIVGCTRSWDTAAPNFTVIIDNMMNLELLFVASDLTGNKTYRDMAISHANTTMINHIREDGSTWHVVDYNQNTGAVMGKHTSQGYADNSTWTRGQSWGIYGFANMYRRTGDERYLETARRLATFFLDNIPSDGIIPWDFNAPVAGRPADSSASTISSTGLLLLAQVETDDVNKQKWIDAVSSILQENTALAWRPEWQSLLSNGTVNKPANNYLTGTVYGDTYFIAAGNMLIEMGLAECT